MVVDNETAALGGLVLCGGKSSRMGVDKALVRLTDGDPPIVQSVVQALSAVAGRVLLSCQDPAAYRFLGLDAVADPPELRGPAAGIVAGLEALDVYPWVLVAACDLPFVTPALARSLAARGHEFPGAQVVVPSSKMGDEPLFALYRPWAARRLRSAASRGVYRLTAVPSAAPAPAALEGAEVARVPLHELDTGGVSAPEIALFNVNDRSQLLEARRLAGSATVPRAASAR
jgi:molybdopterin-guanine dinucleotide biosynthesis protein A